MKVFRAVSLMLGASMLACLLHAQSGCSQPNTYYITCQNQPGQPTCQQGVYLTIPSSSAYGINMAPGYVSCCGTNILSYYAAGGCQIAELRNPKVREMLDELAMTLPIRVASCKGRYVAYTPTPQWTPQIQSTSFRNLLPGQGGAGVGR